MSDGTAHVVPEEYLSGSLDVRAREAAERHLAVCAECREAVAAVRAARAPDARDQPRYRFAPLRVLAPRFAHRALEALNLIGRFGIVLALTVGVLLLAPPAGLTAAGHRALAALVFTASILALAPVALPIAALMVPVAQVALGVSTTTQAFEPFSRPVVFLILSGLFLAEALRKHGLTRRLALLTIVATGGSIRRVLFGLMAVAAFFSMWIENTATAAMLIPVALTISRQVADVAIARTFLTLLVLGIAYSASIGGMGTIMGAASNAVASGFLAEIRPWRFMDWMRYGVPSLVLVFPLTWWLLVRMVPIALDRLDVEVVRREAAKQGPMSRSGWELIAVMIVAIVLWVSGETLERTLALPPTLLSAAMVGIGTVSYLAIRGILSWDDIKGVSWGIFLIIGAGLSLGDVLVRTGATEWFATLVAPVVSGPPLLITIMVLVFLSALLTNLLNNTTIAAVFVPVLISLARADPNFNAVQLVMPVALATTFGYSLPSASGRMALISASGIIPPGDMLRYGMRMTLASSLLLSLFFYLLSVLGWI